MLYHFDRVAIGNGSDVCNGSLIDNTYSIDHSPIRLKVVFNRESGVLPR